MQPGESSLSSISPRFDPSNGRIDWIYFSICHPFRLWTTGDASITSWKTKQERLYSLTSFCVLDQQKILTKRLYLRSTPWCTSQAESHGSVRSTSLSIYAEPLTHPSPFLQIFSSMISSTMIPSPLEMRPFLVVIDVTISDEGLFVIRVSTISALSRLPTLLHRSDSHWVFRICGHVRLDRHGESTARFVSHGRFLDIHCAEWGSDRFFPSR